MAITRCYHATAYDNISKIRREGLHGKNPKKNWNVSDNRVYCWGPNAVDRDYDILSHAKEYAVYICLASSKQNRVAVVGFDVDTSELDTDYSCPGMEYANVIDEVPKDNIREIFASEKLDCIKPIVMSLLYDRKYYSNRFSRLETIVARSISNTLIDFDFIDEIKWLQIV